jgi:hypothetical protein
MSWIEKRQEFQKRYDELTKYNIQAITSDLNKTIARYISNAGVSPTSNNPDYAKIQKLMGSIDFIKSSFMTLNNDIMKYISENAGNNNLTGILKENGELQQHISKLEKIQGDMKIDVESAKARDELLRSRVEDISRHGLFILNRPIRQGLIPYLWALSILFIGVGLVIFRLTLPIDTLAASPTGALGTSLVASLFMFITDKRVLLSLLGSALIVIIFLSLKIAGIFGK